MKILQTNRITVQPYKNFQNNPIRFNTQEDVFIKSNVDKTPSFKGVQQELCKEILGNPKALQKYMAAIGAGLSAAFLALVTGASDNKNSENKEEQFDENMFQNLMSSINPFKPEENIKQQDSKIDEYKAKIEQLEKEKEELKTQLAQYSVKREEIDIDKPKQENIIEQEEQNPVQEMNHILFPKKRGRLSSSQERLKQVVESTQFSEEISPKVNLICEELLKKGSHDINGENIDNNAIAMNFADEILSDREDEESLKAVINDYYVKCELEKEDVLSEQIVPEKTDIQETGLKILGKIDLSTIPQRRKNTDTEQGETITTKRPRIHVGNPNKDFNETTELIEIDKEAETFKFSMPGTLIAATVGDDITRLLRIFEEKISIDCETGEKISKKWMYRHPLEERVLESDIKKEYDIHNKKSKESPFSKYKNINCQNTDIVADIINSDVRYQKLFTLHSAMRFIDRFIDFNSDVPYEEQSKENLDCLVETIQNSFKSGVEVQKYDDMEHDAIGAKIIIQPDCYSEKSKKVFGSFPLVIALCEKQKLGYYSKYNKQGIITTIFPLGT